MAFDPDAYLSGGTATAEFDPDAYLASKPTPSATPAVPSEGETLSDRIKKFLFTPEGAQTFREAVQGGVESIPHLIAQLPKQAYQGLKFATGGPEERVQVAKEALSEAIPMGVQTAEDIQKPFGTPEFLRGAGTMGMMALPGIEALRELRAPVEIPREIPPVETPPVQDVAATITPAAAPETITVYHKTPNQFEVFDPEKATPTGLGGKGVFFNANPADTAYGGKSIAVTIPKDKILTHAEADQMPELRQGGNLDEIIQSKGYLGVEGPAPGDVILYKPNELLTQPQAAPVPEPPPAGAGALPTPPVEPPIPPVAEPEPYTPEAAAARAAEPPQKPSKIGQSIEAKAVEAKLTKGFPETAGYDPITIKDQAARASSLVEDSHAHARAIVRGEAPLPAEVRGTSLITAMEEHLLKHPDAQLAYELANSKLVSITSEAAQEMRLMAERVPDGISTKFAEIKAAREAGAKLRGETPAKIKADISKEVVRQASKRPTWEAFVREIVC